MSMRVRRLLVLCVICDIDLSDSDMQRYKVHLYFVVQEVVTLINGKVE